MSGVQPILELLPFYLCFTTQGAAKLSIFNQLGVQQIFSKTWRVPQTQNGWKTLRKMTMECLKIQPNLHFTTATTLILHICRYFWKATTCQQRPQMVVSSYHPYQLCIHGPFWNTTESKKDTDALYSSKISLFLNHGPIRVKNLKNKFEAHELQGGLLKMKLEYKGKKTSNCLVLQSTKILMK